MRMKIIRLTPEHCIEYKKDIARFIHLSMNRGCEMEWFSINEAIIKTGDLKRYIEESKAYACLAMDEKAEGFVWAYPYGDANSIYLSIIYVNETSRGKSVGKQLIAELEKRAKADGYNRIWLHTDADNTSSRNFYAHIGFHEERIQLAKDI